MYPPVLYFEEARSKQKACETRRITKTRETSIGPGYLIDVRCTCITISEHHTLRDAIQLQQLVSIPLFALFAGERFNAGLLPPKRT